MTLYGPDGRPLVKDVREPWQMEFDRRFRNQMEGGADFLPRRVLEQVKAEMLRRPDKEDKAPGDSFGGLF